MRIKTLALSVLSAVMALGISTAAFAAGWINDRGDYKYIDSEGKTVSNTWRWIDRRPGDSVGDGISWCYFFDGSGIMQRNTVTPDGFWVNGEGAWVHGGNVQQTNINSEIGAQNPTLQSSWKRDSFGFWYQNPDGSYPVNQWKWIDMRWHDTVADGIAWCYYFDSRGYMIANTKAPDGSTVDGNGAWTVNGVAQYRTVN